MTTILVVDDLATNREVLVTLLGYKGHRLIEAADGAEGLAAARAERPDLVITDVLMPVMDGYELVRELQHTWNDLARSFLAPLSPARRERLVAAMAEVELLLTAGLVEIKVVDPADRDAEWCLNEYFAELGRRFEAGFEPALSIPLDRHELRPPAGFFLLATVRAKPIGCGALRFHGKEAAEVKRMWVAESVRGLGVGRRLLAELESRAVAAAAPAIRLETNDALTEAIGLYRSAGYEEVEW